MFDMHLGQVFLSGMFPLPSFFNIPFHSACNGTQGVLGVLITFRTGGSHSNEKGLGSGVSLLVGGEKDASPRSCVGYLHAVLHPKFYSLVAAHVSIKASQALIAGTEREVAHGM